MFEGITTAMNIRRARTSLALLIILLITMSSCVQNSGSGKKSTSDSPAIDNSNNDANSPTFDSSNLTYFQDGSQSYTSQFNINADFSTSFYIRGFQVDRYLKEGSNNQTKHCLVIPFTSSAIQKILVVATSPSSIDDFVNSTKEDILGINPSDKSVNQSFCQTPGILSYISNNLSGNTVVFDLADVCPSCVVSSTLSSVPTVHTTQGQQITDIVTTNLSIQVLMVSTPDPDTTGLSCQTDSQCTNKGYNCCSGKGQCIIDRSIIPGTDQSSSGFLQSVADIASNPDFIYNYNEYYHLCNKDVVTTPDPTEDEDPEVAANERFLELQALYQCTTLIEGEMSVCEKTYKNAASTITLQGHGMFYTGADDLNFNTQYSGTQSIKTNSIDFVSYGGAILYQDDAIVKDMTIGPGGDNSGNDDLSNTQLVTINHTLSTSATDSTLRIRYQVNGSCERISNSVAKCHKYYIQGQDSGKITDHYPLTDAFYLPFYADTARQVVVYVNDLQRYQGSDWTLNTLGSPSYIDFQNVGLDVTSSQEVKISYYVDLSTYPNLLSAKEDALDEVDKRCGGSTNNMRLQEVKNGSGEVISFTCISVSSPNEPPTFVNQEVYVTTKNVPQRFFDQSGAEFTPDTLSSAAQQEGEEFKYNDSKALEPNNINQYIGFNEIYGQQKNGSQQVNPPIQVGLIKGKRYDLTTDSGAYNKACSFCGQDYYSNLVDLFPSSFSSYGGGYTPDLSSNDAFAANKVRRDDQLFGRACFVPITMLPFTHQAETDIKSQRRNRMTTQHFMYANGAGRDWYGFDYGSLIGSFDGVKWFSVGTSRRITAESNVLYLAVNAYFADLANFSSYKVKVLDAIEDVEDYQLTTTDYESTGAECQRYHSCQVDQDCISQLGYDYSCEEVNQIKTSWPKFDDSGIEIENESQSVTLTDLLSSDLTSNAGGPKRCVYRSRGSACIEDYKESNSEITFDGSAEPGLHACTSNTYCQPLISGTAAAKFNDRIARFGSSVLRQNASSDVAESDLDVLGLGARLLGRPYSWIGSETAPVLAQQNLTANNVDALCIPGRSSSNNNLGSNHTALPGSEDMGDLISGVGVTPDLTAGLTGTRSDYLARCSITDSDGNYLTKDLLSTTLLSDTQIINLSGNQSLATNSLAIFENPEFVDDTLLRDFELEFIEDFTYQKNRCLRAPGATCFSNLECAPNEKISSMLAGIDSNDTSLATILNPYEIQFWQEALVCSQENISTDEDFDPTQNRCCREVAKSITIGTATTSDNGATFDDFNPQSIPGLNMSLSDTKRYSRVSTSYDLMTGSAAASYPALAAAGIDKCASGTCGDVTTLIKQFNTFAATASRTCCSKNWIREFHPEDNGGGHTWAPEKLQTMPKESFRCYNWASCTGAQCGDETGDSVFGFSCSHVDEVTHPNCRAKNISESEADSILQWAERYDLTGIPQIAIQSGEFENIACSVDPADQSVVVVPVGGEYTIPPNIQKNLTDEDAEYIDSSLRRSFSSTDPDNFDEDIKRIFSPDTVSCCLPAGTKMENNSSPTQCCSGFINGATTRCALPDYADVSTYFNRYVSSEADELALTSFNDETGFIKNNQELLNLACAKNVCASGTLAPGVSYFNLLVKGKENSSIKRKRFVDGNDEANDKNGIASLVDAGLKWNNHYYCVPAELANGADEQTSLPGIYSCDQ